MTEVEFCAGIIWALNLKKKVSVPEKPLDGNSVLVVPNTQVKYGACVCCDSHRAAELEEILCRLQQLPVSGTQNKTKK